MALLATTSLLLAPIAPRSFLHADEIITDLEPDVTTIEPRPEIRVRGEVVETACYLIGGRRGEEHKQCAIACARAGQSLGILDEKSGLLYLGVIDRRSEGAEDPLLPYVAQRVDVRGEPLDYGDLPALIVSEVRSLTPSR